MRVFVGLAGDDEFSFIGFALAGGIGHAPDAGDGIDHGAVMAVAVSLGQYADGDIQVVGQRRDRPGMTVGGEIRQDFHGVARGLAFGHGERIFNGIRDPQPALVVKGDVDRLMNFRLRSH